MKAVVCNSCHSILTSIPYYIIKADLIIPGHPKTSKINGDYCMICSKKYGLSYTVEPTQTEKPKGEFAKLKEKIAKELDKEDKR